MGIDCLDDAWLDVRGFVNGGVILLLLDAEDRPDQTASEKLYPRSAKKRPGTVILKKKVGQGFNRIKTWLPNTVLPKKTGRDPLPWFITMSQAESRVLFGFQKRGFVNAFE